MGAIVIAGIILYLGIKVGRKIGRFEAKWRAVNALNRYL